jgi:hypothetical protein
MKLFTRSVFLSFLMAGFCYSPMAKAQSKEVTQELSKAAKKGILVNTTLSDDGNLRLTYKMKVSKKSDEVAYEDYVFSKDLQFKGIEKTKENKQTNPDKVLTSISAFVGGSNSFNVMSMSLNLEREQWERKWDYDAQSYKWGKRLSKESVKPKNNDSKYRGFAAYANDDDGSVLVLASYDVKGDDDQFVFLHINSDLALTETKMPVKGNYSLAYCGQMESGNIFAVLAPNEGMADLKKYVLVECNNNGTIVRSNEFTAPSPNMIIMDYREANGNLYFAGASDKKDEAYNKLFTSYAPINNPGYSTAANRQMDKYEKRIMGATFDNFHLLSFHEGKLLFASTTLVKDIKSKVVNPPSQKKSHPYDGKKMVVQNIVVTPQGDILVAGQLEDKKIVNKGSSYEFRYYDYVCMQFDASGNLKTQYAVEKEFNDSKDETFPAIQNFVTGSDGKTIYWELMEVKTVKSYSSLADAFNGVQTLTSNYFPRIATINLDSHTISDFTGLGEKGKYLVFHNHTSLMDKKDKAIFYFGHDKDYDNIWIGKYIFK